MQHAFESRHTELILKTTTLLNVKNHLIRNRVHLRSLTSEYSCSVKASVFYNRALVTKQHRDKQGAQLRDKAVERFKVTK